MGKHRNLGKIKGFSLQFLPFSEIRSLSSSERIKKILDIILGNNILILQGRLEAEEENRLIEETMAMIQYTKSGIRCILNWEKEETLGRVFRSSCSYGAD